MKKFLNFSTILCSYILITLLVISCGDGGEASSNNDVNNGTSQPDNQPDDTGDQYSSDSGDQPNDTGDQHSSDSGDQSDDTGDNSGGQASAGSNSKVVQADLSDKTCLLADRADKEAVVAVLCQGYRFIGLIPKATPDQEVQQLYFLIYSIANPDWDSSPISSEYPSTSQLSSRTWDLSEAVQIQISYAKDYTLSLDNRTDGFIDMTADADSTSDEYLLKNLNIPYVLNDPFELESYSKTLRSVGITFSPTSGSAIKASISGKLAVKTQEDFISMTNFSISGLILDLNNPYQVPFLLLNNLSLSAKPRLPSTGILPPISLKSNDLNLIAEAPDPDPKAIFPYPEPEPKPKFTSPIIPWSVGSFDFDGGGHKITLESEINTLDNLDISRLTGIIGHAFGIIALRNFTLDINAPIIGGGSAKGKQAFAGIIIAKFRVTRYLYGDGFSSNVYKSHVFKDLKINLNSNFTFYQEEDGHGSQNYLGGLIGYGPCLMNINNVVFKTAEDAAIQIKISAPGSFTVGGLSGRSGCNYSDGFPPQEDPSLSGQLNNSIFDVKIVYDMAKTYNENHTSMEINGLTYDSAAFYSINNNLIKLAVSKGENLPADHSFTSLVGLMRFTKEITNNLVYLDFSNIGKVDYVGGFRYLQYQQITRGRLEKPIIYNNMVFIADGFDGSSVTGKFAAFLDNVSSGKKVPVIMNNFFSSPVSDSDYNSNANFSSFAHTVGQDITFHNLILDNKTDTVMFKAKHHKITEPEYTVDPLATVRDRVSQTTLSTLADGPDSEVATILKASDSWEAGNQGYPQLKAPADFSAANKLDWYIVNDMIQAVLAARATRNQ